MDRAGSGRLILLSCVSVLTTLSIDCGTKQNTTVHEVIDSATGMLKVLKSW